MFTAKRIELELAHKKIITARELERDDVNDDDDGHNEDDNDDAMIMVMIKVTSMKLSLKFVLQ